MYVCIYKVRSRFILSALHLPSVVLVTINIIHSSEPTPEDPHRLIHRADYGHGGP